MKKISVICLTYNHEKFITQALDGFLMQKGDFELEVLVHDDFSTDSTPEIIKKYSKISNGVIKPYFETENQFSKGGFGFVNDLFRAATGDYIALCEGDDYWTDPNKLRLQLELMEANPDNALCFHPVRVFDEDGLIPEFKFPDSNNEAAFTIGSLLQDNFIQTNSVMYKKQDYSDLPTDVIPGDWYMHLFHAQFGKIGFIDRVMSSYRKHSGGVWSGSQANAAQFWKKYGLGHLALFSQVLRIYGGNDKYRPIIVKQIDGVFSRLIDIDNQFGTELIHKAFSSQPKSASAYLDTLVGAIRNNEQTIVDLNGALANREAEKDKLTLELNNAAGEIARVKQSKSFLTGYYLLHPKALARFSAQTSKIVAKRNYTKLRDLTEVVQAERAYSHKNLLSRPIERNPSTKLAVVLHLYFVDMWPQFNSSLDRLRSQNFDLFVTIPAKDADFAKVITQTYPNAYVMSVPNRGRDVLPFMQLAPLLLEHGYEYFLKLHSKKSTHRTDGHEWLSGMVDNLVPQESSALLKLIGLLDSPDTAVIGPQGHYVALPVNFNENKHYISRLLTQILGRRLSDHVSRNRNAYGFFAGTMFWARLDAIKPILEQGFTARHFDPEKGQIDATFAHALERLFCLVPELSNKNLYQAGNNTVTQISYHTDNIPDWSDVYVGPK